jgi:hypothetical protein
MPARNAKGLEQIFSQKVRIVLHEFFEELRVLFQKAPELVRLNQRAPDILPATFFGRGDANVSGSVIGKDFVVVECIFDDPHEILLVDQVEVLDAFLQEDASMHLVGKLGLDFFKQHTQVLEDRSDRLLLAPCLSSELT